ncbi:MAG: hypothetical protein L6U99_10990 [Clostridium sp.]|nr:MAG: hypothetical protein L6U99_10990 [Clostridium sp.]
MKDVSNVIINNCSFYLPSEASIYGSSGMIDLFTNWHYITIKKIVIWKIIHQQLLVGE